MSNKKDTPPTGDQSASEPTADTSDLASAASKSIGKSAWTGAAVGIGSAAIVAALLYARKRS